MKVFKFKVIGKPYKIKILSEKKYQEKMEEFKIESAAAFLWIEGREIYIPVNSISLDSIIHEITHAFAREFAIIELSLNMQQTHEFFCELFARFGREMLDISDKAYSNLKRNIS